MDPNPRSPAPPPMKYLVSFKLPLRLVLPPATPPEECEETGPPMTLFPPAAVTAGVPMGAG